MSTRAIWTGGSALVAAVALYGLAGEMLPADSLALTLISDLGFVLVELAVFGLCIAAFFRTKETGNGWIWIWVGLWVGLNFLADSTWAYYEVVRGVVPVPGTADLFYLGSYLTAFTGIIYAAKRTCGRLRALEIAVDALVIATSVVVLVWPFFLEELLAASQSSAEFWVTFAYPVGSLLILVSIGLLLLGGRGTPRTNRLRLYLLVFCFAAAVQLLADLGYFLVETRDLDYEPGSILDPVWLLAFALVGIAALLALQRVAQPSFDENHFEDSHTRHRSVLRKTRLDLVRDLVPYAVLPMLVLAMIAHMWSGSLHTSYDTTVFWAASLILATLVFFRQHLAISINRRLNRELARAHAHLEKELVQLANLNQRLESLNHHLERLQRTRSIPEIAAEALQFACSWEGSPGGWIELLDEEGKPHLAATWGNIEGWAKDAAGDAGKEKEFLRIVDLDAGGRRLGAMYLVKPESRTHGLAQTPDMLPAIAPHVATALENTLRYQEAINMAERDPLTGLFNYRGIHRRLAGEMLRARQNGTELSLIMADLDNFKFLNDTYGHGAGDHVLRQVADSIRAVLRHADLAARIGGDELLLVLPGTGTEGAQRLAERLLEAVAARPYFSPPGDMVPVRMSLGTATYPSDGLSVEELLHAADRNMYASKQRGGHTATTRFSEAGCAKHAAG